MKKIKRFIKKFLKILFWIWTALMLITLISSSNADVPIADRGLVKISNIMTVMLLYIPILLLALNIGLFEKFNCFSKRKTSFKILFMIISTISITILFGISNSILDSKYSEEYKAILAQRKEELAKVAEEKKKKKELEEAEKEKKKQEELAKAEEEKKKQEELKEAEKEKKKQEELAKAEEEKKKQEELAKEELVEEKEIISNKFDNEEHGESINVTAPEYFNRYVVNGLELYLPPQWGYVDIKTSYYTHNNTSLTNSYKEFNRQEQEFHINYGDGFYKINNKLEIIKNENINMKHIEYLKNEYPLDYYEVDYDDFVEIKVGGADGAYHARFYTDSIADIAMDAIIIFKNDLIYKLDIRHAITTFKDDLESERNSIFGFRNDMDIILENMNFIWDITSMDICSEEFDFINLNEE